jgi:hypothetical protein
MADNLIALTIFVSLLSTLSHVQPKPHDSPYLSPTILFKNYNKMLDTLKIYNYSTPNSFNFTSSPAQSLFHSSLLQSPFLTLNPNEAHLFFLPFPSDFSARSLTRHVASIRTDLPYWNRALGADHFFLSHSGIGHFSDRNLVELKKNSIQISSFPADAGKFIPHKDVTLPPLNTSPLQIPSSLGNNKTATIYIRSSELLNSEIVNEVIDDPGFVVETDRIGSSKYCLFEYGGEMSWLGLALASGCVPVVMTNRPIQDLPLMDVLRWSEIALFIGSNGGAERLKVILGGISEEKYEKMRELGVTASQHLVWNASPQPLDAFHMVLYQLWLRRHTIRYTRRE